VANVNPKSTRQERKIKLAASTTDTGLET